MRIAITRALPEPSSTEILIGHEVVPLEDLPQGQREAELASADALLATPVERIDEALLAGAPRLRIVANCAVGYDNIDLAACRRRGIVATNTPGVLTETTADLAMLLILAVLRRLREGEALARSGSWVGIRPTQLLGTDLRGKTLGIYGLGRIGEALARRARAFGMEILAVRRSDGPGSFQALLERSDVISVHAPLTQETRGRFGRDELFAMRKGAFLVNTARGPLVSEEALVEALEAGHLGGAGLDVYEDEPRIHPGLVGRDDVVLLPHLGSATRETRLAMARRACEEIARFFRGEPALSRVDGG
ncbi:MAG: D-glycerate dehydrogenase [Acidobacteria bacterium]|nr:D-glycerate dehydrogenase [Acidobacteriota bacterium]